ncbi:hypothetical protein Tco_0105942 [Tanacetum coccineum]
MKRGFLSRKGGGGGRGVKEKHDGLGNTDVPIGSCSEYEFISLSGGVDTIYNQDGGLHDGNTGNGGATGQVHKVTDDGNPNQDGLEYVMKEAPTSKANKLSPTSLNKANLRKLDTNMPNDADFDIRLPLALVHEVRDRMKIHFMVNLLVKGLLSLSWNGLFKTIGKIDDCPKASKRVVNRVDKDKGGSSGADDAFIEKVSTTGNSSKKICKMNASTSGNDTFSLSYSFEALNVDNTIIEEVDSEGNTFMSDDVGKPLEKIDYTGDHDSEDEVEQVDH